MKCKITAYLDFLSPQRVGWQISEKVLMVHIMVAPGGLGDWTVWYLQDFKDSVPNRSLSHWLDSQMY